MIHCPGCGEIASTTYAARISPEGRTRYLRCKICGHHWTTMEIPKDEYEALCKNNGLTELKDKLAALREERLQLRAELLRVKEENLMLREEQLNAKMTGVTWR